MSILRFIFDITKIQLSHYTNIYKYCGKYQEAFNILYNLIGEKCELTTKIAQMLLNIGLFTNMRDQYSNLISIMETE